jgi:hypothetical protein
MPLLSCLKRLLNRIYIFCVNHQDDEIHLWRFSLGSPEKLWEHLLLQMSDAFDMIMSDYDEQLALTMSDLAEADRLSKPRSHSVTSRRQPHARLHRAA